MKKDFYLEEVKNRAKDITTKLPLLALLSCAGIERGCNSCAAENLGSDWLVAQYDHNGQPFNCWRLEYSSISNEPYSDGIYWLDSSTKNLIHISGWYNRVQVEREQWKEAATSLGINLDNCELGKYLPNKEEQFTSKRSLYPQLSTSDQCQTLSALYLFPTSPDRQSSHLDHLHIPRAQ